MPLMPRTKKRYDCTTGNLQIATIESYTLTEAIITLLCSLNTEDVLKNPSSVRLALGTLKTLEMFGRCKRTALIGFIRV